jgi:hypothetical protein
VLGGLLIVGGTACAAPDPEVALIDEAAGAVLADAADRLAEALEAGDGCRALEEAEALRTRADAALAAGEVDAAVADETHRIAAATTAGADCEATPTALGAAAGADGRQAWA